MDVHPPHHPVSTWREVFIHLGIVTVGLLIALGLESCVEWAHHRHQVEQTREALAQENTDNILAQQHSLDLLKLEIVHDRNLLEDFRYLKQHPGTPMDKLPTVPTWWHAWSGFTNSAWKTAGLTGVLSYMPRDEVAQLQDRYRLLETIDSDQFNVRFAMRRAGEYRAVDQDVSHLTPAEIDRQIELCTQLLTALMGLANDMHDLSLSRPEFAAPSIDEIQNVLAPSPPEVTEAMHKAYATLEAVLAEDKIRAAPKSGESGK